MHHSILNVYFWGQEEQNRLLTDCLGPAVQELWDAGALGRFWFHRFDVRGPHVMALLGTPAEHAAEVREHLSTRLDVYLGGSPSTVCIQQSELEQRHVECRGAQLCSIDALPGFAPNNSYRFADHPADGFLFHLTTGMDEDGVNRLLGELALWSIVQLRAGSTVPSAVRWIAALSERLTRAGADAAEFWQFYASTLLPGLCDRIAAGDPELIAALPRLIGDRNLAVLAHMWTEAEAGPPIWSGADRLAVLIVDASPPTPRHRLMFVREISHNVLAQLDLFVKFRIPLVLYAWLRNLPQTQLAPT